MRSLAAGLALLGIGFTLGVGTFWLVQGVSNVAPPSGIHDGVRPPSSEGVPSFQREPDFLTDRDALGAFRDRLQRSCAWTGRIRYLHFDSNHVAVVLAEIEGGGIDSVVFSFGQVIRTPVAMDEEEKARLEQELFALDQRYLDAIPAAVESTIQANPTETTVDSVVLLGIAGAPRMEIRPVHPREVLDPVVTPL